MKKNGFTLSEVMVALALIGVITSLTIPTFVASNRNKSQAAKLGITVSAVENAFTSMIAAEAVQDLTETNFAQNPNAENLGRYLKLANSGNYAPEARLTISGGSANTLSANGTFYETKNGAKLMFCNRGAAPIEDGANIAGRTVEGSIGILTIDTNGDQTPNIWGRDTFMFRIGDDGLLYPAGSLNFSVLEEGDVDNTWDAEGSDYCCTDANKGLGCAARLIENNYNVDY